MSPGAILVISGASLGCFCCLDCCRRRRYCKYCRKKDDLNKDIEEEAKKMQRMTVEEKKKEASRHQVDYVV
jgi:hypothetical protein